MTSAFRHGILEVDPGLPRTGVLSARRTMKRTVTIAAGVLAIILVGCGGSAVAQSASQPAVDDPISAPSPTAMAVPTATPTPLPTPSATPDPAPPVPSAPAASDSERPTFPKGAISTGQAVKSIGNVKTVCGEVVAATYAKSSAGSPTFLNLDKARGRFTIVIWKEYRSSFDRAPEKLFDGVWVCIQGKVSSYRGVPQIRSLGGDVADASRFIPLTGEARRCLAKGASMSIGCTVVVDEQRSNNQMTLDALDAESGLYDNFYADAQSDLGSDLYGELP